MRSIIPLPLFILLFAPTTLCQNCEEPDSTVVVSQWAKGPEGEAGRSHLALPDGTTVPPPYGDGLEKLYTISGDFASSTDKSCEAECLLELKILYYMNDTEEFTVTVPAEQVSLYPDYSDSGTSLYCVKTYMNCEATTPLFGFQNSDIDDQYVNTELAADGTNGYSMQNGGAPICYLFAPKSTITTTTTAGSSPVYSGSSTVSTTTTTYDGSSTTTTAYNGPSTTTTLYQGSSTTTTVYSGPSTTTTTTTPYTGPSTTTTTTTPYTGPSTTTTVYDGPSTTTTTTTPYDGPPTTTTAYTGPSTTTTTTTPYTGPSTTTTAYDGPSTTTTLYDGPSTTTTVYDGPSTTENPDDTTDESIGDKIKDAAKNYVWPLIIVGVLLSVGIISCLVCCLTYAFIRSGSSAYTTSVDPYSGPQNQPMKNMDPSADLPPQPVQPTQPNVSMLNCGTTETSGMWNNPNSVYMT